LEVHFRTQHGDLVRGDLRAKERERLQMKAEEDAYDIRGIPVQKDSPASAPGMGRRTGSRARRRSQ
jgi:hypothetical protein